MNFRYLVILILTNLSVGCATQKKAPNQQMLMVNKVTELENEIRNLREQNAILKKSEAKPAKIERPAPEEPIQFNGEHSIYSAVLEAFWAKDLAKLDRLCAMFLKAFPKSVHADNALYMLGQLQVSQSHNVEALKTLNELVQNYPKSAKVVSAEYLKAQIYRRMNLNDQADELLRKITKNYRGSIEALRAKDQIKGVYRR